MRLTHKHWEPSATISILRSSLDYAVLQSILQSTAVLQSTAGRGVPGTTYLQAPTRESYTDMTPRRRFPGSIVDLSVRRPPATAADERAW